MYMFGPQGECMLIGVVGFGAGEGVGAARTECDLVEVEEMAADVIFDHCTFILGTREVMGFGGWVGHKGNELVNGTGFAGGRESEIGRGFRQFGARTGAGPVGIGKQGALDFGCETFFREC